MGQPDSAMAAVRNPFIVWLPWVKGLSSWTTLANTHHFEYSRQTTQRLLVFFPAPDYTACAMTVSVGLCLMICLRRLSEYSTFLIKPWKAKTSWWSGKGVACVWLMLQAYCCDWCKHKLLLHVKFALIGTSTNTLAIEADFGFPWSVGQGYRPVMSSLAF